MTETPHPAVLVIAFALGAGSFAAGDDACDQYTNLTDPWRNRGFASAPSELWPRSDSGLKEGWYRFTGVGGGTLDYCRGPPIAGPAEAVRLESFHIRNPYPSTAKAEGNMTLCGAGAVEVKLCYAAYYVHRLRPVQSFYATRHYGCTVSSCGDRAKCGRYGDCVCEEGYELPKGLIPTGDTYGCTDIDECRSDTKTCKAREVCVNSQGSYYCECVSGYLPKISGDSIICIDQQDLEAKCKAQPPIKCSLNQMIDLINASNYKRLPPNSVVSLLAKLPESLYNMSRSTVLTLDRRIQNANRLLRSLEDLVDMLVPQNVQRQRHYGITTRSADLQMITIGPDARPRHGISSLKTNDTQLDIDLYKLIDHINNRGLGSAAVLVFSGMEEVLTSNHVLARQMSRGTGNDNTYTIVSKVISVSLHKMPVKQLLNRVNFTLKHKHAVNPQDVRFCGSWNSSAWVADGCDVTRSSATHTACSCDHLSAFAVMVKAQPPPELGPHGSSRRKPNLLVLIAMVVGLFFLALTLLTFALCGLNPKLTNMARLHLCISLLLAHLLFLLVQEFLHLIRPHRVLCKALSGLQNFLFLCGFQWMQLDTVLLFLSIRMVTRAPGEGPGCGHLSLIGYGLPLVIAGVVFGLVPEDYGIEWCGVRTQGGLAWSLLVPAYFIFIMNLILFLVAIISLCLLLPKKSSLPLEFKNIGIQAARVFVQFLFLMSPWMLGLFWYDSSLLDIIFLLLLSQQGTFIFLIHCILNLEVCRHWKKWCQKLAARSPKPLNNM